MQRRFEVGAKVYSSQYGVGEVVAVEGVGDGERMTIRFQAAGVRQVLSNSIVLEPFEEPRPPSPAPPPPAAPPSVGRAFPLASAAAPPGPEAIKAALREVLGEMLRDHVAPEVKMMDRWRGGTLIMRPGREGQKEKDFPIEEFFHKIVMVRDRLRVMEQKINAHPGLGDADKVELQQYITRIYGSLTTFNVLFADRDDWFVGQKGE
jgi:PcrA/UvrD helicase-like protein